MSPKGGDRGGLGYLLIGQPAISSMVARALATKGDQPQFLEGRYELGVQALNLGDFEYRWLRRETTWVGHASQAAVGAQVQVVQFGLSTAPFGRTVLAIIEEITICNDNAAAQRFHYGLSINTAGATSGPFFGYPQDDRPLDAAGAAQSACFVATQSNAAGAFAANRSGIVTIPAGNTMLIRGPWVISGKPTTGGVATSFCVQGGQSNLIVTAGFRWREREMMSSEL